MDLKGLKKHADKYGIEGVMAAGLEDSAGLTFAELVDLQTHLDGVEKKRMGGWAPNRRLTAEDRVKRLLGWDEDEAA